MGGRGSSTNTDSRIDTESAKKVTKETVNVGKKLVALSSTNEFPVAIKKVSFRDNKARNSEFIDVLAYADANHNAKWVANRVSKVMESEGFIDQTGVVITSPTNFISLMYEKKK